MSRRTLVLLVALTAIAGCSSARSATAPPSSTTTGARPAIGNPQAPLAQFSVAEALRLPPPTGADAAALLALARGAPATIDEVLAARNAMSSAGESRAPSTTVPAIRASIAMANAVVQRYPTAADAERAGYRLASRFIPGVGAHWIKWSLVTAPFNAGQPSMLLYDGNGLSARLAGLSYYTESSAMPVGFRAGVAQWHRHIGLCIVHGVLIGEGIVAPSACAQGLLLPGRNIWMLHVWVVPGMANKDGVFAPVNPALCTAVAPCTAPPK